MKLLNWTFRIASMSLLCVVTLPAAEPVTQAKDSAGPDYAEKKTKKSGWYTSAFLGATVAYDGNVFLQSKGALADEGSWVAGIDAGLSAYHYGDSHKLMLDYRPRVRAYEAFSSENFIEHAATVKLKGKNGGLKYETKLALTLLDGAGEGPEKKGAGVFASPAGSGVDIYKRRDAWILKYAGSLRYDWDTVFLRGTSYAYSHDFLIAESKDRLNFHDVYDVNAGFDVGKVLKKGELFGGYRWGYQNQDPKLGKKDRFGNHYHRLLLGYSGKLGDTIELSLLAGPDFREFGGAAGESKNASEVLFYSDTTATIKLGKRDKLGLGFQFAGKPSPTGSSFSDGRKYKVYWKHRIDSVWSTKLGFLAYHADYEISGVDEDWIYTPSFEVHYHRGEWDASFSYAYTDADVADASEPGRAFSRGLAELSVSYSWDAK